ncbi:MAG: glycosyltransferase family 39 protein [Alphaproteobacteria bacterium]|nr:glycosyltransferase family 39 protein [Alphaproteobacteria bacterium]
MTPRLAALAVIGAVTAWRLMVLAWASPNLSFDEAQYWFWAQDLAFGYYSKPPLVAWAIAATTLPCGEGEACVKLSSPLAWAFAAWMAWAAGARLWGPRAGFWAAALFITLPGVSLSAMVVSTDPLLLAAWTAGLAALARALDDDRPTSWLLVGLAVGVGLLAKYAMAFFLPCLVLFLAWSRRPVVSWRLAAVIGPAALFTLPNLAWNAANGFVSYLHTRDNANLKGALFNPDKLAEFVGGQFAVFGPLTFGLLLYLFLRPPREERVRLTLCFSAPILAFFAAQALLSRANANWAAAAYPAGVLLVAGWASERARGLALLRASLALHLVAAAVLYDFDAARAAVGLGGTQRYDILKRVRGWDRAGAEVGRMLAAHPGARLLVDERKLLATLLYYVTPHPFDALKWNPGGRPSDHFDLTMSLREPGADVVLITDGPDAQHVAPHFAKATPLGEIRVPIHADYQILLRAWLLEDFQGYAP